MAMSCYVQRKVMSAGKLERDLNAKREGWGRLTAGELSGQSQR